VKQPALLVIALALVARPLRAQDFKRPPYAAAPTIAWQTSVQAACDEAIENHKPLVVLFALDPSHPTGGARHVSNEQRLEFDRPELSAVADKAVFAVCYYDSQAGSIRDDLGEKMRASLEFESLPTTVVFAPRSDVLFEIGRYEGLYTAAELVSGFGRHFRIATMTDEERAQHYAFERATANPRTPQEAIAWYSNSFKNADPNGIARAFAQPYGTYYKSMADCSAELSAAKQRLSRALRDRFGRGADLSDLGFDLEAMRAGLAAVSNVGMVRVKSIDGKRAVVEIEFSENQQPLVSGDMDLVLEAGVWRILPAEWQTKDIVALYDNLGNEAKFLAMQLDSVTDQVRRGEFTSHEQALAAAQAAGDAPSLVNNSH
jgi:hypothetical protein